MYRFENITGVINDRKAGHLASPVHYAVHTNYGILAAGYNPLMWLMALLLAAVVAGCGGNGSIAAPVPAPGPGPGPSGSLAAVNLLTAGNYAILAVSAITCNGSCVPATSSVPAVTGKVALSGVAASIVGFTMTQDSSNTFWTAPQVAGNIYATDNVAPTPATVSQASADMVTAYNDAAGRPAGTGAFLNAGAAGDIGGLTLAPGVYTWTTPVNVTISKDVTLNGSATDVWIFQISGTFAQAAATKVILSGGALAKNIFWQVGAGATLDTTAHIEGVILSGTAITLNNGATGNSRLMAQSAVTLGGTVTQPAP